MLCLTLCLSFYFLLDPLYSLPPLFSASNCFQHTFSIYDPHRSAHYSSFYWEAHRLGVGRNCLKGFLGDYVLALLETLV